ncbi:MAG TPA: FUSC family protein, partial [Thermomicrobiales bacterium]|nr:FUSC family protein [Thermomicrobiales bacterium]
MAPRGPMAVLLRSIFILDRTRISLPMAARNTVGFAIPLILLTAIGHPALGVVAGIGTLNVSFSDQAGTDYTKAPRMLAASALAAISVFAGAVLGNYPWIAAIVLALWGFGGGMFAALGVGSMQVGVTALLSYLAMTGNPATPSVALGYGALALAGGVLQTSISILDLSGHRVPPERRAIATAYRALGAYARKLDSPIAGDAPATTEMLAASQLLLERGDDPEGAGGDRMLFDIAQRIQFDLIAIGRVRTATSDIGINLGGVQQALGNLLDVVAGAISGVGDAGSVDAACGQLRHAIATRATLASIGSGTVDDVGRAIVDDRLAALVTSGELLGATVTEGDPHDARRDRVRGAVRRWAVRLQESWTTLQANLTLNSAVFRHAIRLAVALVLAQSIALVLGIDHGYWAPLTIAVILRPDFAGTITRGVARLIGTGIGLVLGTAVVHFLAPGIWEHVIVVTVLTFTIRWVAPSNAVLAAIAISCYIVTLLSMVGIPASTSVADRALNTAFGGVLGLAIFLLWPTWEAAHVRPVLAGMVGSFRRTFRAVMSRPLGREPLMATEIHRLRLRSRLTRTNAAAAVARLMAEPEGDPAQKREAQTLITGMRELAVSTLTLEGYLGAVRGDRVLPQLGPFLNAADGALVWIEGVLDGRDWLSPPPQD